MLNHSEVMDAIKEDLATLGIGSDKLDCFTAEDARIAYLKTAREVHPDKADRNNPEQLNLRLHSRRLEMHLNDFYSISLIQNSTRKVILTMTRQFLPKKTLTNSIFRLQIKAVLQ